MQSPPVRVLATDLDGTFLAGSPTARRRLYRYLDTHPDRLRLFFVTGRDIPFVRDLVARGELPAPEYVIGDVGTSIVNGRTWQPVDAVQAWVANRWQHGGDRARALLHGTPGLSLQDTPFERRVSYHYVPGELPDDVPTRIQAAGFDCLMSANTYLDVLPRGVHKGSSLLRLLDHLGLDPQGTLVAGDTLNDRALFETGLPGVVVGGAEPALVEAVGHLRRTWIADGHGCEGIWQALERLGHLDHEAPADPTAPNAEVYAA